MDDDNDEDYVPPANSVMLVLPNEPDILLEYEAYRPSRGTRRLYSERAREIYPEAFIENMRLGTLSDLCVRALAKLGTRYIGPVVNDRCKLRVFFDALDVDEPLKDCYFVNDLRFWRRVVLAKSDNKCLKFKKLEDYDWRGQGISLKFVELVENCPAAYWPEKQMAHLGQLVRYFVRTLHISRLQSLDENFFSHYVESESELEASSDYEEQSEVSSDEKDTSDDLDEMGEEEEVPDPVPASEVKVAKGKAVQMVLSVDVPDIESSWSGSEEGESRVSETKSLSVDHQQMKRREARRDRNAARKLLREMRLEKKLEHERRKKERALHMMKPPPPPKKGKKAKKKKEVIKGAFDITVDPEPDDGEDKIADKRNKKKLLRRLQRYDYPPKHCHHIDLSFVRYFDLLSDLTIEFKGPEQGRNYHKRHLNFSYDDMSRLAKGLRSLQRLKIFRLRNSRMDNMKLLLVCRALRQLKELEVVDFGYDRLQDDCSVAVEMLLDRNVMLKSLELEYNNLARRTVHSIGSMLRANANNSPEGKSLEYLGLAHNLLDSFSLDNLVQSVIGTNHLQVLNINGVGVDPEKLASAIDHLLRNHSALRRLDMAANTLSPHDGHKIICALQTNHKVLHFDCRGCDFSEDQEYEADIILRRNNYVAEHTFLGDDTQTEESLLAILRENMHPVQRKLQEEKEKQELCLRSRPLKSSSDALPEEIQPVLEEPVDQIEPEFDIWQTFAVPKAVSLMRFSDYSSLPSEKFSYHANDFNIHEVRQHLQVPGPSNRYYYFQQQKDL
ncbi:hypothetical protein KR222_005823 [Zaprionus bogoriensis]|nr:hypothetical protein KR222_005823 [Zaprionus bogoriensis]